MLGSIAISVDVDIDIDGATAWRKKNLDYLINDVFNFFVNENFGQFLKNDPCWRLVRHELFLCLLVKFE